MNTIGNYAPDFEIPGIDKEVYHLGSYLRQFEAIAVVFMGNTPTTNRYLERLKQIQADFGGQKFTLFGIDSNYCDEPIAKSMETMREYASSHKLNFPLLRDSNQDVAKGFKAKVTPTVYLLDSSAVIRYQGRIDDCAEAVERVEKHYLRDSVATMLAGGKISRDYVTPVGSEIVWRAE